MEICTWGRTCSGQDSDNQLCLPSRYQLPLSNPTGRAVGHRGRCSSGAASAVHTEQGFAAKRSTLIIQRRGSSAPGPWQTCCRAPTVANRHLGRRLAWSRGTGVFLAGDGFFLGSGSFNLACGGFGTQRTHLLIHATLQNPI